MLPSVGIFVTYGVTLASPSGTATCTGSSAPLASKADLSDARLMACVASPLGSTYATLSGWPLMPPLAFVRCTTRSVLMRISAPSIAPTPVTSSMTPTVIGEPVGAAAAAGAVVAAAAGAEVAAEGAVVGFAAAVGAL